jgi:hypothetical protein
MQTREERRRDAPHCAVKLMLNNDRLRLLEQRKARLHEGSHSRRSRREHVLWSDPK